MEYLYFLRSASLNVLCVWFNIYRTNQFQQLSSNLFVKPHRFVAQNLYTMRGSISRDPLEMFVAHQIKKEREKKKKDTINAQPTQQSYILCATLEVEWQAIIKYSNFSKMSFIWRERKRHTHKQQWHTICPTVDFSRALSCSLPRPPPLSI